MASPRLSPEALPSLREFKCYRQLTAIEKIALAETRVL
jgi:hypothetical protein